MRTWLSNTYHLGLKEFAGLMADVILVFFTVYWFSFMVYSEATGVQIEVQDAAVAVVDGDRSFLSRRLTDALRPPEFEPPVLIDRAQTDVEMDAGRFTFVLDIPPHFEADLLRGHAPTLQLNVDATAVSQAGTGAGYISEIINREVGSYLQMRGTETGPPVDVVIRALFNPNTEALWFQSLTSLIDKITLISILLVGAAVIREREHGTIEHLLVMPLRASEIAAAKIWANGLVILAAAALCLAFVIRLALQVPFEGSVWLFLAGTGIYLFATTSLGILLATFAKTMPQFGLLLTIVFMNMTLLSGATSPLETMPQTLQILLQISPAVHFVDFVQGVLFRAAGVDTVWPQIAALAFLGCVFSAISLARFRLMLGDRP